MNKSLTLPVTEGHVWHRVHSELIMLDPWLAGFPVCWHETKYNQGKGDEGGGGGGGYFGVYV